MRAELPSNADLPTTWRKRWPNLRKVSENSLSLCLSSNVCVSAVSSACRRKGCGVQEGVKSQLCECSQGEKRGADKSNEMD